MGQDGPFDGDVLSRGRMAEFDGRGVLRRFARCEPRQDRLVMAKNFLQVINPLKINISRANA